MKDYTRVSAILRINHDRHFEPPLDFEKIFGKQCRFENSIDIWKDARDNPDEYLPMGNEGSLDISIWENYHEYSQAAYTVSIFGDLRDYEDPHGLIDWFKSKLKNLDIIQAMILVNTEDIQLSYIWEPDDADDIFKDSNDIFKLSPF